MSKKKEIKPDLTFEDLKVGRVYRAKKPKLLGMFERLVDDRSILHISQFKCPIINKDKFRETDEEGNVIMDYMVQYDSPSVREGRKYPTVTMTKFIKWASHDVTDLLPEGEWAKSL